MKFCEKDIYVLLENSKFQPSENYNVREGPEVYENLTGIEFINSQVNSLQKLFSQLSPSDKTKCIDYLLSLIDYQKDHSVGQIAFNTLIHIFHFNEAFQKLMIEYKSYKQNDFYKKIIILLGEILRYEWSIFTREQVDEIYKWTNEVYVHKTILRKEVASYPHLFNEVKVTIYYLHRKLNIIKTFDLKNRIFSGTSQEITTDERALKVEFKRYNFPNDLSETLDKLDMKIATATDNFDHKSCMDLIRVFSERLF